MPGVVVLGASSTRATIEAKEAAIRELTEDIGSFCIIEPPGDAGDCYVPRAGHGGRGVAPCQQTVREILGQGVTPSGAWLNTGGEGVFVSTKTELVRATLDGKNVNGLLRCM